MRAVAALPGFMSRPLAGESQAHLWKETSSTTAGVYALAVQRAIPIVFNARHLWRASLIGSEQRLVRCMIDVLDGDTNFDECVLTSSVLGDSGGD